MTASPVSTLIYTAPFGLLRLEADDDYLQSVRFCRSYEDEQHNTEKTHPQASRILKQAAQELDAYFLGTRTSFDVPLQPLDENGFSAYIEALRRIPYGHTITYTQLSERAASYRDIDDNRKGGPRAAARACARNRFPLYIPCHRILPKGGGIGGFAGTPPVKKWLLAHEKIISASL